MDLSLLRDLAIDLVVADHLHDDGLQLVIVEHSVDRAVRVINRSLANPLDLLGVSAPGFTDAIGVVGPGAASSGALRVVHLIAIDGACATAVSSPDGADARVLAHEGGRIDDLLRRTVELPTRPTTSPPSALAFALLADWALTAALDAHLTARPLSPADVESRRAHFMDVASGTWSEARRRCATSTLRVPGIAASHASWMDDPMFGRWSLYEVAEPTDVLADVAELVPGETFGRLLDVADAVITRRAN